MQCVWLMSCRAWVLPQDEKADVEASQGDIKLGTEPKGVGVSRMDSGGK